MIKFKLIHLRATQEHLGYIPEFLSEYNPKSTKEQIDENYGHGGGWHSMSGFQFDPATRILQYPGDPPMKPLAEAKLRDEIILIYPHAWVLILQPDGSFDIARID